MRRGSRGRSLRAYFSPRRLQAFLLAGGLVSVIVTPLLLDPSRRGLFFFEYLRPACKGRWVYTYDLPAAFNTDLLSVTSLGDLVQRHRSLNTTSGATSLAELAAGLTSRGASRGQETGNSGLGPTSDYGFTRGGVALGEGSGWYASQDVGLEQYFHGRMQRYACRTRHPERASVFYVPYFMSTHLLLLHRLSSSLHSEQGAWQKQIRDLAAAADDDGVRVIERLLSLLEQSPHYRLRGGADHFLVSARPAQDLSRHGLRRSTSKLFGEGGLQRATILSTACSFCGQASPSAEPWLSNFCCALPDPADKSPSPSCQFPVIAIPPLSFYHPATKKELIHHKDWMLQRKQRELLAAVALPWAEAKGGERVEGLVPRQCEGSAKCAVLLCSGKEGTSLGRNPGELNRHGDCTSPPAVMDLFHASKFCIQPPEQAATNDSCSWPSVSRPRGIVDALTAGCAPVFIGSPKAHLPYPWHLPSSPSWAVLLSPGKVRRAGSVQLLGRISRSRLRELQQGMARLLPSFLYLHPLAVEGSGKAWWLKSAKITQSTNSSRTSLLPLQPDAFDLSLDAVFSVVQRMP